MRAQSRGDRRGAQRRRLRVYLAPSSCTSRRATPGPRRNLAAARLGLRASIAAKELGSTATTTRPRPPPRSRPRTRHRRRLAGAVPIPLLTGGSAAPLSTATLLSTLEIGLGPSAARPPRRGAGRPIPNTISGGGGPSGGQRVGLRLAHRPPRCRNSRKECRRRACPCKSSTGLEEYRPGLGSCGCVGQ